MISSSGDLTTSVHWFYRNAFANEGRNDRKRELFIKRRNSVSGALSWIVLDNEEGFERNLRAPSIPRSKGYLQGERNNVTSNSFDLSQRWKVCHILCAILKNDRSTLCSRLTTTFQLWVSTSCWSWVHTTTPISLVRNSPKPRRSSH